MKKTKAFFALLGGRIRIPRLLGTGFTVFAFVLGLALFGSCGLETYIYLEPVEIVVRSGPAAVTIRLPSQSAMEFQNYIIYYRIYFSASTLDIIATDDQRGQINTFLRTHYSALESYTSDTSVHSGSLDLVFTSRGYYLLGLRERPDTYLSDVLDNPGGGGEIDFNFSLSSGPTMTVDYGSPSAAYNLYRNGTAYPGPNRNFMYTLQLANETISETSNKDLEQNTGSAQTSAYVSMYILASGVDNNLSTIHSRPKHIGIFRLPVSQ